LTDFILKKFTRSETHDFVKLSKSEYSNKNPVTSKDFINWKFSSYFIKPVYIYKYLLNNKCTGRVMLPQNKLIVGDDSFETINPCDLLIHKSYRKSPNIFLNLIKGPRQFSNKIFIHTSNNNSDKLYRILLKYKKGCVLDAFAFPSNILFFIPGNFLNIIRYIFNFPFLISVKVFIKLLKFITNIETTSGFPSETEEQELYDSIKSKKHPFYARSKKFFRWRYSNYNSENVYSLKIMIGKKAIINTVLLANEFKGFKVCMIMDSIASDNAVYGARLLNFLCIIEFAMTKNSNFIFSLFNKKSHIFKSLYSFVLPKIPSSFLPHETPLYIRDPNNLCFDRFHCVLSDLDYF